MALGVTACLTLRVLRFNFSNLHLSLFVGLSRRLSMYSTRASRRDLFLVLSALWLITMAFINLFRTVNRLGILDSTKLLRDEQVDREYSGSLIIVFIDNFC